MIDFLRSEGVSEDILSQVQHFRQTHSVSSTATTRIPHPIYKYYGKEVYEEAIVSLLSGENILLVGAKATGKNVLAQCLSALFGRPTWDISFHINTDSGSLIGTDTFVGGEVRLREGPILSCAKEGGFGILDEINMAKNEALAVLHATLDFRHVIDVPGYERIELSDATRFIATMNYGYAGTREINEALASRFMVINMPIISEEILARLLTGEFPTLREGFVTQFVELFSEIRKKSDSGEISTKSLDLRGLLSAIKLAEHGLPITDALMLGLANKCFDPFEHQLVEDIISTRLPRGIARSDVFQP